MVSVQKSAEVYLEEGRQPRGGPLPGCSGSGAESPGAQESSVADLVRIA
jgi:hypothetical protein